MSFELFRCFAIKIPISNNFSSLCNGNEKNAVCVMSKVKVFWSRNQRIEMITSQSKCMNGCVLVMWING